MLKHLPITISILVGIWFFSAMWLTWPLLTRGTATLYHRLLRLPEMVLSKLPRKGKTE